MHCISNNYITVSAFNVCRSKNEESRKDLTNPAVVIANIPDMTTESNTVPVVFFTLTSKIHHFYAKSSLLFVKES